MSTDLVFYQDLLSDIKNRIRLLQFNVSILPMPLAKLETVNRKPSVSQLPKEPISPQAVAKLENPSILQLAVAKLKDINLSFVGYNYQLI